MKDRISLFAVLSLALMLLAAPAFAAAPFKVNSTTPADLAVDVPLDSDVTIIWNRNVDCGTVNTSSITITGGGWALASCGGSQAVFATSGQTPGTTYAVNVSTAVADTSSQAMKNAYSMSYTTASGAAVRAGYTVVAKSGGDYTGPLEAIADIGSWCEIPVVDDPCVMKVRPGTYDLAFTLDVPAFVSVEGTGAESTILTSNVPIGGVRLYGSSSLSPGAAVIMNDGGAIRDIQVANNSDVGGVAILVHGSVTVGGVIAVARGFGSTYADYGAIFAEGAGTQLTVRDTEAHAESLTDDPNFGDALAIAAFRGAHAEVTDVKAAAGGGAFAAGITARYDGSTMQVHDSVVNGWNTVGVRALEGGLGSTVRNTVVWSTHKGVNGVEKVIDSEIHGVTASINASVGMVATSMLDGPILVGPVLVHCWDAAFAPIPDTNPAP